MTAKSNILPKLLPAIAALALLGLSACGRSTSETIATAQTRAGLVAGDAAPAWTLQDVDGNAVSFADYAGKVVVVDFWATWCAPCLEEIPGYIAMQEKYGPEGFAMIGISVDTKPAAEVKAFAEAHAMNYPVLMADAEVMSLFKGIDFIPTTFLIGRDGMVIDSKVGSQDTAIYAAKVQAAL